jgi:hypothetical protein
MRTVEAAEDHYCDKHGSLMGQFIESLEAVDLTEVDIEHIFKIFAKQVRSGKIKKKRRPKGPKVSRKPRAAGSRR